MRTVSMECIPAHTDNENSKYGMYTCSHRQ